MSQDALILFSGDYLHVEVHRPEAGVLFVTFDHWRRDRTGFAAWEPSRTVARLGMAELIIKTSHNDWFMNPDLPAVREVLRGFTGRYRTVRCFAFSMGAFAALLLSRPLRLRQAVLVSPQWSIFPDEPPFDRKYAREAALLDRRQGDLAKAIRPELKGVILYDPVSVPKDGAHARLIATHAPGMKGVAMALFGHPATEVIAQTGAYGDLWRMAHRGQSDPSLFYAVKAAARRASPIYEQRLRDYLAKRAARVR